MDDPEDVPLTSFVKKKKKKKKRKKREDERNVECPDCGKKFFWNCTMEKHRLVHTGAKPHKCKVCKKAFNSRYSLKTHSFIHTDEKPFQCSFCNYACRDSSTLRKHQHRHMGVEQIYRCKLCEKSFKAKYRLKMHVSEKHLDVDTKKIPCSESKCEKLFRTKKEMSHHVKLVHERAFATRCPVCDMYLPSKYNLSSHLDTHVDARPFMCNVPGCQKTYKDRQALRKHVVIHDPDAQFPCDICGRLFTRKERLARHIVVVHGKMKRVQCDYCKQRKVRLKIIMHMDICGRLFTRKKRLARHVVVVHGKMKRVQCDYCKQRFYSKNYLIQHITRKHTKNRKKYICDLCGLKTYNKPSIVMHIKHGHGNENDRECQICHTVYKKYIYLKHHYKYTHNIAYKTKTRPQPIIKEEPPDDTRSIHSIDLFEIDKEEPFEESNLDPGETQQPPDVETTVEFERLPYVSAAVFDEFYVEHITKINTKDVDSEETTVPDKIGNIDLKALEYAKTEKKKYKELGKKKEIMCALEKTRQIYNEKMKKFINGTLAEDKAPIKVKFFRKSKVNKKKDIKNEIQQNLEVVNTKTISKHDNEIDEITDIETTENNNKNNPPNIDKTEYTTNKHTNDKVMSNSNKNTNEKAMSNSNKNTNDKIMSNRNKNTNDKVMSNSNKNTNDKVMSNSNKNTNDKVMSTSNNNDSLDVNNDTKEQLDDENLHKGIGDENTAKLNEQSSDYYHTDDDDDDDKGIGGENTAQLNKQSSDYYHTDDDDDEDFNDEIKKKTSGKINFNSHQCYICFKLYETKEKLIEHCKEHFDICSEGFLKKCPLCPYVTKRTINIHLTRVHGIKLKIPYARIQDKKDNNNGSRYFLEINDRQIDKMEVIPSVKNLNKMASMKIDKKFRESKNKTIAKTKLVRKGKEWVVETEKLNIDKDVIIPKFDDEILKNLDTKVNDKNSYFDSLKKMYHMSKKSGKTILFPCQSCDKICRNLSALKLHNRKHETNPKPFKKKVWKHKLKNGETEKPKTVKKVPQATENRTAKPKPIKNKHKCDPELKAFYENNIRGGDIEFWQFLKIFNKMGRDNIQDFEDLEGKYEYGMGHHQKPDYDQDNNIIKNSDQVNIHKENTENSINNIQIKENENHSKNKNNKRRIIGGVSQKSNLGKGKNRLHKKISKFQKLRNLEKQKLREKLAQNLQE